jgi:hypothetical protein
MRWHFYISRYDFLTGYGAVTGINSIWLGFGVFSMMNTSMSSIRNITTQAARRFCDLR